MIEYHTQSIPFGKYKGKTIGEIFKIDYQYAKWISQNLKGKWKNYFLSAEQELRVIEALKIINSGQAVRSHHSPDCDHNNLSCVDSKYFCVDCGEILD